MVDMLWSPNKSNHYAMATHGAVVIELCFPMIIKYFDSPRSPHTSDCVKQIFSNTLCVSLIYPSFRSFLTIFIFHNSLFSPKNKNASSTFFFLHFLFLVGNWIYRLTNYIFKNFLFILKSTLILMQSQC